MVSTFRYKDNGSSVTLHALCAFRTYIYRIHFIYLRCLWKAMVDDCGIFFVISFLFYYKCSSALFTMTTSFQIFVLYLITNAKKLFHE